MHKINEADKAQLQKLMAQAEQHLNTLTVMCINYLESALAGRADRESYTITQNEMRQAITTIDSRLQGIFNQAQLQQSRKTLS